MIWMSHDLSENHVLFRFSILHPISYTYVTDAIKPTILSMSRRSGGYGTEGKVDMCAKEACLLLVLVWKQSIRSFIFYWSESCLLDTLTII